MKVIFYSFIIVYFFLPFPRPLPFLAALFWARRNLRQYFCITLAARFIIKSKIFSSCCRFSSSSFARTMRAYSLSSLLYTIMKSSNSCFFFSCSSFKYKFSLNFSLIVSSNLLIRACN